MQSNTEKLLLTVNDVCRMLSIGRSTFFTLRSGGKIPLKQIKLGGKLLYSVNEVKSWAGAGCPTNWQGAA
jgi:predicted DNA-binding transcriptional regulator AlpA